MIALAKIVSGLLTFLFNHLQTMADVKNVWLVSKIPLFQAYDVLVTSRQSGKAWTVQSQGCSHPGSHIVLPLDSIFDPATHQTSQENGQKIVDDAASGSHLASQLLRLRYGVFAELDSPNHVTGEHYTHCQGRTVSQVIPLNICRRKPFTNW